MSNHNHYETVGKVIFSVKEQTDAHLLSDDTGFSDEQIYYYLLQCRSLFLYRKYRTYRDVSQKDYMTTPCMNLIDADNQCPCKPPTGCEILMTELYHSYNYPWYQIIFLGHHPNIVLLLFFYQYVEFVVFLIIQ